LPELFIEKYTDHPAELLYLGSTTVYANLERVQLSPDPSFWSHFWPFSSSFDYKLEPPVFAIRFGSGAGPAEAEFAAFFTFRVAQIAQTEVGRPLAELFPYAQAVALFRWLSVNDIPMNAQLLELNTSRIDTPLRAPPRQGVRLTDVSPSAPGIIFNDFGP